MHKKKGSDALNEFAHSLLNSGKITDVFAEKIRSAGFSADLAKTNLVKKSR